MRQNRKDKTLADAAPVLEQVHQAVGELMNEALEDARKEEKAEARRVGVPYSLQPHLILKFERILGRRLRDGAELRDVKDAQFFIGNVIEMFRTLTG